MVRNIPAFPLFTIPVAVRNSTCRHRVDANLPNERVVPAKCNFVVVSQNQDIGVRTKPTNVKFKIVVYAQKWCLDYIAIEFKSNYLRNDQQTTFAIQYEFPDIDCCMTFVNAEIGDGID